MRGHVLPCESERKEKQMVMVGSRLPGCGLAARFGPLTLLWRCQAHTQATIFCPFETKFNASRW